MPEYVSLCLHSCGCFFQYLPLWTDWSVCLLSEFGFMYTIKCFCLCINVYLCVSVKACVSVTQDLDETVAYRTSWHFSSAVTHKDITLYQTFLSFTIIVLLFPFFYLFTSIDFDSTPCTFFLSSPPFPPPSILHWFSFFLSFSHSLSLSVSLQRCQLALCQGMLISAGRLGPANMAKRKERRETDRQEREEWGVGVREEKT